MNDQGDAPDPNPPLPEAHATRCVACKQEIPAGASLCSVCKSYQRPWKNHLLYISGIAAMIALIISATFWLLGNGRVLLGFGRDDVRLITANTLSSGVVVNRGDREVFVSHLLLIMPGRSGNWQAPRPIFEERLPVGQFLRREFPRARLQESAEFVRGLGTLDFEKLLTRAANGDPCLELAFFVAQDSLLRELSQMGGPTVNTFEVGGYLEYWRLTGDAPVDLPVKATGFLRRGLEAGVSLVCRAGDHREARDRARDRAGRAAEGAPGARITGDMEPGLLALGPLVYRSGRRRNRELPDCVENP